MGSYATVIKHQRKGDLPAISISVSLAALRCTLVGVTGMLLCASIRSLGTSVASHPVSNKQGTILPSNSMPRYTGSLSNHLKPRVAAFEGSWCVLSGVFGGFGFGCAQLALYMARLAASPTNQF